MRPWAENPVESTWTHDLENFELINVHHLKTLGLCSLNEYTSIQCGWLYFPKAAATKFYVPHVLEPFHKCIKRKDPGSLPLKLGRTLWIFQPTKSDRRDATWLLRLDHNKAMHFYPVLLGHWPVGPSYAALKKCPCGKAMASTSLLATWVGQAGSGPAGPGTALRHCVEWRCPVLSSLPQIVDLWANKWLLLF